MRAAKEIPQGQNAYEWIRALLGVAVSIIMVFTFAVRIVSVSGESMRETLQDGDRLLVVNALWCGDYRPGDIVIVGQAFSNQETIVKRVVATAGQTVDIDFETGSVYVDGVELDEPYIRERTYTPEGTEFPLTVPEGCVFVLGDNRNDSKDSRHIELGAVDTRKILGKAVWLLIPGKTAELDRRELSRIGSLN